VFGTPHIRNRPVRFVCDALPTLNCGQRQLESWSIRLTLAAGAIANYCDHVEHNETADHDAIRAGGRELRDTSLEIAAACDADLRELYAERLAAIERRNVLSHSASYNGAEAARHADTWRALQLALAEHDRYYHPDVIGMSKWDQLHHHTLHIIKLASATAAVASVGAAFEDWVSRRLPDMLLFGIKLSTVSGERLPEEPLPELVAHAPLLEGIRT
jgi:hypothetical protein